MATLKINSALLLDGVAQVCVDKLKEAGISVTVKGKLSTDELLEEIKHHEAVVVRSATQVTAAVLAAGTRLQLVGRAGVGTDNIDVRAATRRGVLVMNTPTGNTVSAAEHTCALICALGRSLPQACASVKGGAWDKKAYLGTELCGKTLAVVGLGRIGREVAKRMQSFEMTVIGYDPFVDAPTAAQWDIEAMPLEELWPQADYITVHTPLLPHTRNLLGEEVLMKKCKPGVRVVNVARGGIVDEAALLKALDAGRVAGAALDVFVEEPPTDLNLCKHPKVICTPHLGANTVEAQQRVAEELADQMVAAVAGKRLMGLVNGAAMAAGGAAAPWLEAATALGRAAAEGVGLQEMTGVTVSCFGPEVASIQSAVVSAALAGLLHRDSHGEANLVNADLLAEERRIKTVASSSSQSPQHLPPSVKQSITVTVVSSAGTCSITGSMANGLPLMYGIGDCVWECGVPLIHTVLLYRFVPHGSGVSAVPSIASAVSEGSDARLVSIAASGNGASETWYAVRTVGRVSQAPSVGEKSVGVVNF